MHNGRVTADEPHCLYRVWRVHVVCLLLSSFASLVGDIGSASARNYGAGEVAYLVNLWNTNRQAFEGVVQGVDTFSSLGTVRSISQPKGDNAISVIVDIGMNARVECPTKVAAVDEGKSVMVSGRIATVEAAVSQMENRPASGGGPSERPRDILRLQSCTVQKAFSKVR